MEYVIDPKWFYWLYVIDGVNGFCIIFAIISGAVSFGFLLGCWTEEEFSSLSVRIIIISASICVLFIAACILIPDKETMILMKTAELTTYSNIATVGSQVKEIIDYIIETISNL